MAMSMPNCARALLGDLGHRLDPGDREARLLRGVEEVTARRADLEEPAGATYRLTSSTRSFAS